MVEVYVFGLTLLGVCVLASAALSRVLAGRMLSPPLVYYLAHALNQQAFSQPRLLRAVVGLAVLVPVVAHGLAAQS